MVSIVFAGTHACDALVPKLPVCFTFQKRKLGEFVGCGPPTFFSRDGNYSRGEHTRWYTAQHCVLPYAPV